MKKKNILLTLALPLLVLSACGENESPINSESTKDSESQAISNDDSGSSDFSSSQGDSSSEINQASWASSFAKIKNFTALSSYASEGTSYFTSAYFGEEGIKVVESERKEVEDLAKNTSEFYLSKASEGSYIEYLYVDDISSYQARKYPGVSAYEGVSNAILEAISSSFSSFGFVKEGEGYLASSLSYSYAEQSSSLSNVAVHLKNETVSDVSFDAAGEDGISRHIVLMEINSTYVSLPSGTLVKKGYAGQSSFESAMNSFRDDNNATFLTYSLSTASSGSTIAASKLLFDGEAAKQYVSLASSSSSENPNIINGNTNVEEEHYYSFNMGNAYRYDLRSDGLYEKSVCSEAESPWRTYKAVAFSFDGCFSKCAYDENSDSYKCDELTSELLTDPLKDIEIKFSCGALSSISCTWGGSTLKISDFGTTEVALPGEEEIYNAQKVNEEGWMKAFASAEESLNFTCSSQYHDASSNINSRLVYDGNALDYSYSYTNNDDSTKNDIHSAYYSKEGDSCYSYVQDGGFYKKEISSTDQIQAGKDLILLFAYSYEDFAFSAGFGVYCAPSLTLDGISYTNIQLTFLYGEIYYLTYASQGFSYEFTDFGTSSVTLPDDSDVYYEGKVSEETWKTALSSAQSQGNFTLSVDSSEGSVLKESVYACDGDNVEFASTSVSDAEEDCSEAHGFYSRSLTSYCAYYKETSGFYKKKTDEESASEASSFFALAKSCFDLFSGNYESFSFDKASASYVLASLAYNGSTYSDLSLSFVDSSLSSLSFALDGKTYAIKGFGQSSVSLPSEDELWAEGKVNQDAWETSFLEVAESLDCTYETYDIEQIDGSRVAYQRVYSCSSDAILCDETVFQGNETEGSKTSTCFVHDGDAYYLFTENENDGWDRKEDSSVSERFSSLSDVILLFSENYGDFTYDSSLSGYKADTLTIDGKTYTDVRITFEGGALSAIKWSEGENDRLIENIGTTIVSVPAFQ